MSHADRLPTIFAVVMSIVQSLLAVRVGPDLHGIVEIDFVITQVPDPLLIMPIKFWFAHASGAYSKKLTVNCSV